MHNAYEVIAGARGFPPLEVYRNIKMVVFDVDGVLTDGRIIHDSHGAESKFFNVRDGAGITFLIKADMPVAFLTGRSSSVVDIRAAELNIPPGRVKQGAKVKLPVFMQLLAENGIRPVETAYIGDDIIDIPVLQVAGLTCCPADAYPEVIGECHVVACANSGQGAVRAIIEHFLKSRQDGSWERAIERYLGRA